MIKLSVVCCVLFFGGLSIADNVPALIWGPFDHYTPAVALKSYNGDEFIDVLSEYIRPDTLTLVIAEDQLSTEDLSQCRTPIGDTCFRGIQQVKSKLYLPNVEDPFPVVEDVAGMDKSEVSLLSNGELSEPLNAEGGNYVFVSFQDDATEETKAAKLSRHDQLISKLSADLAAKNINYMIIYTGKRAEHHKRAVRQVVSQAPATSTTSSATTSATTATTSATTTATSTTVRPKQAEVVGTFWKRERLLIYYLALEQIAADGTATPIAIDTVTVTAGEPPVSRLEVSMDVGTDKFAFNVSGDSGYWWVHDFKYNNEAIMSHTRIAAVDTFSFHCSPSIEITTLNRATWIRWTGLQIQPQFTTAAEPAPFDSFGDSWDCVGFVSPGIVGGLFVVIMLLFILSIGISWMMDINTMDRFDDPKGKTITISVNE